MTSLAGREFSVRDVMNAACELPCKMSIDDAPVIIREAVCLMLDDPAAKQRVDFDAVDNGSKINALEALVAYVQHVAGRAYDTRHQRAQGRIMTWAEEVGLTLPSISSAVPF